MQGVANIKCWLVDKWFYRSVCNIHLFIDLHNYYSYADGHKMNWSFNNDTRRSVILWYNKMQDYLGWVLFNKPQQKGILSLNWSNSDKTCSIHSCIEWKLYQFINYS